MSSMSIHTEKIRYDTQENLSGNNLLLLLATLRVVLSLSIYQEFQLKHTNSNIQVKKVFQSTQLVFTVCRTIAQCSMRDCICCLLLKLCFANVAINIITCAVSLVASIINYLGDTSRHAHTLHVWVRTHVNHKQTK